MTRQLVLIHGRAQEHKDSVRLKQDWIDAWRRGLEKSGLALPIAAPSIRFPYFGDTLFGLTEALPEHEIAEVVVRGTFADVGERDFVAEVLDEVVRAVAPESEEAELEAVVRERGILNVEAVQALFRAIDRHLPGGSGASIAIATRDVYHYLKNPNVRKRIDDGVLAAFTAAVPTVVVSHSLGTVVAYSVLRREAKSRGWRIPLLVTLGSPLAVTAVKKALKPIRAIAEVGRWLNAMDPRDVVPLYPLDQRHFKVDPPIENKVDVDNHTDNRHGIAGYLDDAVVAKRIHDALAG